MRNLNLLADRLRRDDYGRLTDLTARLIEEVETERAPSPVDLWRRRMTVKQLKLAVKKVLTGDVPIDDLSDWREQADILNSLMLENFTRQAVLGTDGVALIPGDAVKFSDFVSAGAEDERRVYMGLHNRNYDNDGLSVISVVQPPLHVQPFHAHSGSGEQVLAIHPTTGVGFSGFGVDAEFMNLSAGEMVDFAPRTPHTLQNPTHFSSANVVVKVPETLGDRVKMTRGTIGDYLSDCGGNPSTSKLVPEKPFGEDSFRYRIANCGHSYVIDFVTLARGSSLAHLDLGEIAQDSRGLMTVFPELGREDARIYVERDERHEVSFGEWLVLGDQVDGFSLTNMSEKPVGIYIAREVPNL